MHRGKIMRDNGFVIILLRIVENNTFQQHIENQHTQKLKMAFS